MRQLTVSVPAEFEDAVLGALEGACQLKNITRNSDGLASRLTCYVAAQECGVVLHELDKVGCGTAYGKVALLPVQLLKPLPNFRNRHLTTLVKQSSWSVEGRMATEEIYTNVASGTELTFDYLAFVIVAGLIAAVGLATNSSVMIVASMLVSPLMGPILAFAFGTSVQDLVLVKKGLFVETVGVALTFMVGFCVGLGVCAWTGVANFYDWPTAEMVARGEDSSLIVGVFFAVPSGAGVALSTTQGGTNALVGVAIAASLLPPITNTGMCLAFAAAGARRVGMDAGRFFRISGMSFALFAINVACIYLVCILFFWVKKIKKVRKQLSTYRDLPPLKYKVTTSGNLVGAGAQSREASGAVTVKVAGSNDLAARKHNSTGGSTAMAADIESGHGALTVATKAAARASTDSVPPDVRTPQSNPSNHLGSASGKRAPSKSVSSRLAVLLGPFLRGQFSGSHGSGSGPRGSRSGLAGQVPSQGGVSGTSTPPGSVRLGSKAAKRAAAIGRWRRVRKAVLEDGSLPSPLEGDAEGQGEGSAGAQAHVQAQTQQA